MEEPENKAALDDLNREIKALREQRINLEQQSRTAFYDYDAIDDIEVKVTANFLGELGSSSASQTERDSGDEELVFIDADSGASDRGKKKWI
jgi:hypothetical protein